VLSIVHGPRALRRAGLVHLRLAPGEAWGNPVAETVLGGATALECALGASSPRCSTMADRVRKYVVSTKTTSSLY
jgi:hypothetical protein